MQDVEALLAEQVAYYRARAPEYTDTAIPELPTGDLRHARDALIAAIERFRPASDVLELACGPGTWTPELLRHADTVTAVDSSPEMLELASAKVDDERARFILADLFTWGPDRRYDVVFFGFWLSHVPLARFERFWSLVNRCLAPGGRVAFVDDAYRTAEELIEGEESEVVLRPLRDGTQFRAVKVPHTPEDLELRLQSIGWDITVSPLGGPFFWGSGTRASNG
jgi:ubiquinone/menaquinone biosynthesis C-methylase UbiE